MQQARSCALERLLRRFVSYESHPLVRLHQARRDVRRAAAHCSLAAQLDAFPEPIRCTPRLFSETNDVTPYSNAEQFSLSERREAAEPSNLHEASQRALQLSPIFQSAQVEA